MKKYLIVLVLLCASLAYGKQEYNAFTGHWETVPDNSNWSPRYNAMEDDWSYQPREAQTQYNAYEDRFEWNSGHNERNEDDN